MVTICNCYDHYRCSVHAVYISQLLNVTHTLQVLNMWGNVDIGDDGMAMISQALQHNKSLTTLRVDQCGLSVKGTVVCKMYDKFLGLTLLIYVASLN